MAKNKDQTIEERLKNLYKLQLIDSELDQIQVLKGELPMEVADLEDEITGLEKRVEKMQGQLDDLNAEKNKHEKNIKEANMLIERYDKQLDEVKNNREFQALQKEIELQQLEIKLSEKRIKETDVRIENKQETLDAIQEKLDNRNDDLKEKKVDLEEIQKKTEKEEKKLMKESDAQRKKVEERLLESYDRIRKSFRNGLAVVTVERESCAGCFNKIPPQIQNEINSRKHIVACEHCGRILVDDDILKKAKAAKA